MPVQTDQDGTSLPIDTKVAVRVADSLNDGPHDGRDIYRADRRDLAKNRDQTGAGRNVTSHPRERVLLQNGIQNPVGYLIA
ncbi:hypothetical protein SDC9_82468 [bioreactor metagenome]|uniref:Uncharacterized protein n=1 Tax=bioreactor metagenome TaxID=1076179 RepID=A0A644ZDB1_9ZZZZ